MRKVALLLSVVFFAPLLATAFLVASSSEANAAVDVVCFNDLFQRKIGEPRHETNTFPGVKGPATVKVYNGDGSGWLDRANFANVIINGKVIFRSTDFNKRVKYLQAQVNLLEGNNTVDVNLLGMPGVRIRVEVVQGVEGDAAGIIGPQGGVIENLSPQSPLYGVQVEIPPNAVDSDILLSISESNLEMPNSGNFRLTQITPAIKINAGNISLAESCLIKIPYQDSNNDGLIDGTDLSENDITVYYVSDDVNSGMIMHQKYYVDTSTKKIIVETNHFSTWIGGAGGRWKENTTVYYEISSIPTDENYRFNDFAFEIDAAFKKYEDVLAGIIRFSRADNNHPANITIEASDLCSGLYHPDCESSAITRNVFGHLYITFNKAYYDKEKAINWIAYGDDYETGYCNYPPYQNSFVPVPYTGWAFNAYMRIALHEIGHSLGLPEYWDSNGNVKHNSCQQYSPCNASKCANSDKNAMYYDTAYTVGSQPIIHHVLNEPFINLSGFDIAQIRSKYNIAVNWSSPQPLSATGGAPMNIVVGDNGVIHIVYVKYQNADSRIYYRTMTNGSLSSEQAISPWYSFSVVGEINDIALSKGPNGTLHLMYDVDTGGLYYLTKSTAGSWTTPQPLSATGGAPMNIVVGDNGVIHIVYVKYQNADSRIYYRTMTNGSLSSEQAISPWYSFSVVGEINDIALSKGPNGTLHLMYDVDTGGLYYLTKSTAGSWTTPQPLSATGGAPMNIVVGDNGVIHIVYVKYQNADSRIYYRTMTNGSLSSEQAISPWYSFSVVGEINDIALSKGPNGTLHLMYDVDTGGLYYLTK